MLIWPSFLFLFVILSKTVFVFIAGTGKKCNACVKAPKISWIQKIHGKLMYTSTNPPIKERTVVPPTEDEMMNARAYCWSPASKRPAIIPRVAVSSKPAFYVVIPDRTGIVQRRGA